MLTAVETDSGPNVLRLLERGPHGLRNVNTNLAEVMAGADNFTDPVEAGDFDVAFVQIPEELVFFLLSEPARRNVMQNAGIQTAFPNQHLADRQLEGKGPAAFVSPFKLTNRADDVSLAGSAVPREMVVVLRAVRGVHEHGDITAQYFVRRITKHPFRSGVDILDRAKLVDRDDAVHGRLDDGAGPFLGFSQQIGGSRLRAGRRSRLFPIESPAFRPAG